MAIEQFNQMKAQRETRKMEKNKLSKKHGTIS